MRSRQIGIPWIGVLLLGAVVGCSSPAPDSEKTEEPAVPTGDYLGQEPPGLEPKLFAPGFLSTGLSERDIAITDDGRELYFCASLGGFKISTILVTRQVNGVWTQPEVVPFASRYLDFEPALSADNRKLFFLSNRPGPNDPDGPGNEDIWLVEREGRGWGEPSNLGPPVNTDAAEFFPSLTRDGTLYFTREEAPGQEAIYRSRFANNRYQEPERLPEQVNSGRTQFNAFIDRDERYIIVPVTGREDSLGGTDYYVVFRSEEDRWSEPVNMGPAVNSSVGREWSPYVSPDGRYLFFMSSRTPLDDPSSPRPQTFREMQELHGKPLNGNSDIWWIDAGILGELRKSAVWRESG